MRVFDVYSGAQVGEGKTSIALRVAFRAKDRTLNEEDITRLRGKLEPAEMFHEVLQHRWYLAEQAGHDIETFVAAHDYIDNVLSRKPEEAITSAPAAVTEDAI